MNTFKTLIYGDGDSPPPIQEILVRMLGVAAQQRTRLHVRIRSTAAGASVSRCEHAFECDPVSSNVESLLRALIDCLNVSPGEGFAGQIRINFSGADEHPRYGSWTRTIQPSDPGGSVREAQITVLQDLVIEYRQAGGNEGFLLDAVRKASARAFAT